MADSELTQGLIDYLKSDAVVLKQMAQDNKQANEVMKVTMDNLKETLIEIKDFMKGVSQGYVTVKDFDENREQKKEEHQAMWERIKRLEWGFIVGAGSLLASFFGLIVWAIFQK